MTRNDLERVSAELRHAYLNLVDGRVTEAGMREFADGLLAPQIRKLEEMAITITDIPAIERERDQAFIALTNVGGALVDAGSIEVPATVQDYGEAVRVLIGERDALQRDFSQELSAHRQTLAELELARGEHASDRNRFENVLSNLHAIARDVGCDRRASIGLDTSAVRQLRTERDAARVAVDKYKKELATAWTDTEAARASEKAMGAQLTEADREVAQMEAFAEMVVGRLVTAGHDYSRDYHLTGCEGCRNLVASIEALYAATPPAETKESDK